MLASPAAAVTFTCTVNPGAYLGMNSTGSVLVAINGGTIQAICNVSQTMGGVTPQACTAWYSTLLTWRTTNKIGNLYFDSTDPANTGFTSCAQAQQWQTRIPYHIEGA